MSSSTQEKQAKAKPEKANSQAGTPRKRGNPRQRRNRAIQLKEQLEVAQLEAELAKLRPTPPPEKPAQAVPRLKDTRPGSTVDRFECYKLLAKLLVSLVTWAYICHRIHGTVMVTYVLFNLAYATALIVLIQHSLSHIVTHHTPLRSAHDYIVRTSHVTGVDCDLLAYMAYTMAFTDGTVKNCLNAKHRAMAWCNENRQWWPESVKIDQVAAAVALSSSELFVEKVCFNEWANHGQHGYRSMQVRNDWKSGGVSPHGDTAPTH